MQDDMPTILQNIREKLIAGVEKRLDADAPVGFLLSGGLDSSLVCSIAAKKLGKPIRTFAIGMDTDAIDLKYARQTADYLGSEHHEIIINREMVLSSLEEVIRLLGTWDITTIRASMGMYLLCKAIHEQTDVRVLLTGEISDELFGYNTPTTPPPLMLSSRRARSAFGNCICTMCCGQTAASPPTASKPACPLATWILCATSWPSTRKRS